MFVLPDDYALARLDAGEAGVIALAQILAADLVIIDETQGRREAAGGNLVVTGTLTVLLMAAERGLIDFPPTVARLRQSGFRASAKLIERFLDRDRPVELNTALSPPELASVRKVLLGLLGETARPDASRLSEISIVFGQALRERTAQLKSDKSGDRGDSRTT